MKYLIYGSKGWIGGKIKIILEEKDYKVYEGTSRCDNVESLQKEFDKINPSHVFSCIGRTRGGEFTTIDYLEQKGNLDINLKDNLYSPLLLAQICKERGIHMTYIGTGCIYTYKNNVYKSVTEKDPPNFTGSAYSTCKGYTDKMINNLFSDTVLTLRVRMPIDNTDSDRNLINKLVKYKTVINIPNSMTVIKEMLPLAVKMSQDKVTGTFNFTNKGAITHSEILDMYIKYVDKNFKYEIISLEQQGKKVQADRSNIELNVDKLFENGYEVSNIKDAIEYTMKSMAIKRLI